MRRNIDWDYGSIEREYRDNVLISESVRLRSHGNWTNIELYKAPKPYDYTTVRTDVYYIEPGKMPVLWLRDIQRLTYKNDTCYSSIRHYRYSRTNGRVVEETYSHGLYRDCKCLAWHKKTVIDGSNDYT